MCEHGSICFMGSLQCLENPVIEKQEMKYPSKQGLRTGNFGAVSET